MVGLFRGTVEKILDVSENVETLLKIDVRHIVEGETKLANHAKNTLKDDSQQQRYLLIPINCLPFFLLLNVRKAFWVAVLPLHFCPYNHPSLPFRQLCNINLSPALRLEVPSIAFDSPQ